MKKEKNENEKYFESLPSHQKLHPYLKKDDLLHCIELIVEFYEDMTENHNKDNNKSG